MRRCLALGEYNMGLLYARDERGDFFAVVEEMPAAVAALLDQTNIRFMNQRRRLQGLSRFFVGQPARRELAQLFIDKRQQLFGGVRVAGADSVQKLRDFIHVGPRPMFRGSW